MSTSHPRPGRVVRVTTLLLLATLVILLIWARLKYPWRGEAARSTSMYSVALVNKTGGELTNLNVKLGKDGTSLANLVADGTAGVSGFSGELPGTATVSWVDAQAISHSQDVSLGGFVDPDFSGEVIFNIRADQTVELSFRRQGGLASFTPNLPPEEAANRALARDLILTVVRRDDVTRLGELLGQGADIHARFDEIGPTALEMAVIHGRPQSAEFLLKRGAAVGDGLSYAAERQNVPMLDLLLAHGGDLDAPLSSHRNPPLSWAVEKGDLELVRMFIASGADVNRPGINHITPTFIAARLAHDEILAVLIAAGADVNIPMIDGRTPIQIAKAEDNARQHGARVAGGRSFEPVIERLRRAGAKEPPLGPQHGVVFD